MSRRLREGGALGHLLLVVVLALGVFMMHTVGHPDEPSGSAAGSHASMAATDPGTTGTGGAMTAGTGTADMPEPSHVVGSEHSSPTAGHPAMAMDMMSLCVAVLLSAWVIASLVRSALARRADWASRLLARGPVAQRHSPPPRAPDLTQLSVLRL